MEYKKVNKRENSFIWLPIVIALIFTIAFAIVVVVLAISVVDIGGITKTRWEHFFDLSPNAIGDTLAGVFGSLTLIWVVASVFQQSLELRAQRVEFSEMVKAQDAQVRALNAQAEIFLGEQRTRTETSHNKLFEQRISEFCEDTEGYAGKFKWRYLEKDDVGGSTEGIITLFFHAQSNSKDDVFITSQIKYLLRSSLEIGLRQKAGQIIESCSNKDQLGGLQLSLNSILELADNLSLAKKSRLERIKIPEAILAIDKLSYEEALWSIATP